jgi:hypothetical protein
MASTSAIVAEEPLDIEEWQPEEGAVDLQAAVRAGDRSEIMRIQRLYGIPTLCQESSTQVSTGPPAQTARGSAAPSAPGSSAAHAVMPPEPIPPPVAKSDSSFARELQDQEWGIVRGGKAPATSTPAADVDCTPPLICRSNSQAAREKQSAEDEAFARQMEEQDRRAAEAEREVALNFDCPVCVERRPVEGSFTASCPEMHRVCEECIVGYLESKINEPVVPKEIRCVLCPHPLQDVEIVGTLKGNGLGELEQRFVDGRTEQALDAAGGQYRRCPHDGCNYLFAWEAGDAKHFECPLCASAYCLACTAGGGAPCVAPAHPGKSCDQRRAELEADARQKHLFDEWQENNRRAQELFEQYVREAPETRACPRCGTTIQKSEACDHMTCSVCSCSFCIVCGKQPQCGVTCPRRASGMR